MVSVIKLILNFEKCHVMSFTKKRSTITWFYVLFDLNISCAYGVVDLSFKCNNCLDAGAHIDVICRKAFEMLGFIKKLVF